MKMLFQEYLPHGANVNACPGINTKSGTWIPPKIRVENRMGSL